MALEKFNKVGMRDKKTKKVVIFPKYSEIGDFCNGFAIVTVEKYRNGIKKTLYGYLTEDGKEIPAIYTKASEFYENGFAAVERDGAIGILLKDGTEHLFKGATTIWPCSGVEGIYKMLTWEGWGYIKIRNGEYTKLTEAKYSVADDFIFSMAHVAQGVYSGIIDENGKEVLPLKYGSAEQLSENLFHVTFDGKSVIIDRNEDVLLEEVEYVEIRKYTKKAYALVHFKDGTSQFMSDNGKLSGERKYNEMERFISGMMKVVNFTECGMAVGLVNEEFKELVAPFVPNENESLKIDEKLGVIVLQKDNEKFIINKKGETIKIS